MSRPTARKIQPAQLASVRLFSGLAPKDLERVLEACIPKAIETGEYFFMEADPADRVFVITHGRIRLTQVTPEGQQIILRIATPVEEFGVIALLTGSEYPVSAQAVEDSTAIYWDHQAMNHLMAQVPQIPINAVAILADRVREFQDRVREMATERVERRVARALLRLVRQAGKKVPEGVLIDLPLSRQDLAQMTGTTLFTVSRTLSGWESRGIIQAGRERIVVLFPHGLVSIAEDLPSPETRE